jgi:hypothetical protein
MIYEGDCGVIGGAVNTNPLVVLGMLVMKIYIAHYIYEPNMTSTLKLVSYEGEMVHILNHL